MVRLSRLIAATVLVLVAGGLAACGGSGGSRNGGLVLPTDPTTTASTATSTTAVPARNPQGEGNCSRTSVGFTPLTDLAQRTYHGFQGGLYPGGHNTPSRSYLNAGLAAAAQVRPLASNGAPSPSGRIVLLSIGMSNTSREFTGLVHVAASDRALTPGAPGRPAPVSFEANKTLQGIRQSEAWLPLQRQHVMLVNGAYPNYDAELMTHDEATYLKLVDTKLTDAGVSGDQVQAAWIDEAIANEHRPFPADAQALQRDLGAIISMLTAHFPNLRLVYISSREYAGYSLPSQIINPEPYAYESGFAVKWAIAGRIAHPATRPWVAWGPYTWANGTHPRSDGLSWSCSDFGPDGTHPSDQGSNKVGRLLLGFFTTDPTARNWFNAKRG